MGAFELCTTVGNDNNSIDKEEPSNGETKLSGVPNPSSSNHSSIDGERLEDEIHHKINDKRESLDRQRLEKSERVRRIARGHSKSMATGDFYAHVDTDGNDQTDRHEMYDGCTLVGENIIIGHKQDRGVNEIAESLVERWVDSEGHYENLKSQGHNVSGVGVYVTEDGTIYATQNFCREHPDT
ncbi:CAP domain-containing protein [Natronomonas pharaonis]|uniref:CAP domain-containing protein n=1 Tax=Natronomonas pharaonis TaxID=2257 RepID=UPI0013053217|nr:CAP domain-containing protein [Natronomonas pharaonis]